MGIMSVLRGRSSQPYQVDPLRPDKRMSSSYVNLHQRHMALPEDDQGWQDRYNWLHRGYECLPYDDDDVKALRLFKAVDVGGKTLAMAQRLYGDFRFVIDTDVRALCGGAWSLNAKRGATATQLKIAQAVWDRSGLQAHKASWVRSTGIMGDGWLHPVRFDDGYRLVFYDCRHCQPTYYPDGITLKKLSIRIPYLGEPDEHGNRAIHVYHRELTETEIVATEDSTDGRIALEQESGEHKLGVVPAVHLRAEEIAGLPEHSLSFGHGLDLPMAAMDSFVAQIRAVTERYASPMMVAKGVRFDPNDDVQQFGRTLSEIHADAEISYLEPDLSGLVPLQQIIKDYLADARATIPEFILSGAGANTSGRALEFRADQLKRKIEDASHRITAEIAKATHMAVLMSERQAYDGAEERLRIMTPPPLPIDRPAVVTQARDLRAAGLIKRADAVRMLQTVGVIDSAEDPEAYAKELAEETPAAPTVPNVDQSLDDQPIDP